MTYGHKMDTADTSGGRGRRFKSSHPDQRNQCLRRAFPAVDSGEICGMPQIRTISFLTHYTDLRKKDPDQGESQTERPAGSTSSNRARLAAVTDGASRGAA